DAVATGKNLPRSLRPTSWQLRSRRVPIVDYVSLIRQAWTITWRYRFLWLLGLLAGGAVGMPALNGGNAGWQTGSNPRDVQQLSPGLASAGAGGEAGALAHSVLA